MYIQKQKLNRSVKTVNLREQRVNLYGVYIYIAECLFHQKNPTTKYENRTKWNLINKDPVHQNANAKVDVEEAIN